MALKMDRNVYLFCLVTCFTRTLSTSQAPVFRYSSTNEIHFRLKCFHRQPFLDENYGNLTSLAVACVSLGSISLNQLPQNVDC